MITFKHKGNFERTDRLLKGAKEKKYLKVLDKYGQEGVAALAAATPTDSGLTAESWDYKIQNGSGEYRIMWTNSNVNDGVPIAIIIQYGHGTGTGGYVQGRDYINPAMRSVFDNIADKAWEEVKRL